jgi:DNA-binding transcriptional LysR family regulator
MSLRQMEYLLAVLDEGSFTAAARRLDVSQPALSHQVRALEGAVGETLLERTGGAVHLTPAGREYAPLAAAAVRAAEEARRACRDDASFERLDLRIATLYSVALGILPPAIRAWRVAHPEARLELREYANAEELAAHMALGVADVGVGPRPRSWSGPLTAIGEEELVVVLAADDPLAGRRRLKLNLLAERKWVLYATDNSLGLVVDRACAAAGFAPRAAVRTRHTATAVALAAAGLGPTLAPRSIIDPSLQAALVAPDPPVRRELVAYAIADHEARAAPFIALLAARGVVRRRPRASRARPARR